MHHPLHQNQLAGSLDYHHCNFRKAAVAGAGPAGPLQAAAAAPPAAAAPAPAAAPPPLQAGLLPPGHPLYAGGYDDEDDEDMDRGSYDEDDPYGDDLLGGRFGYGGMGGYYDSEEDELAGIYGGAPYGYGAGMFGGMAVDRKVNPWTIENEDCHAYTFQSKDGVARGLTAHVQPEDKLVPRVPKLFPMPADGPEKQLVRLGSMDLPIKVRRPICFQRCIPVCCNVLCKGSYCLLPRCNFHSTPASARKPGKASRVQRGMLCDTINSTRWRLCSLMASAPRRCTRRC
jgi:hypothetical protein